MTLDELRSSNRIALSIADVARALEVDERTVRRACAEGQIPSIKVGGRLLVPREKLLVMVATG